MKSRTKKILNFVLIFGTLALVLLVGINGQEMTGAVDALKAIAPVWIVLCVGAYLLYLCLDAYTIWHYLRCQGYKVSFRYALFNSIIGMYYSNVTPVPPAASPCRSIT